jgi:hypothetical protein
LVPSSSRKAAGKSAAGKAEDDAQQRVDERRLRRGAARLLQRATTRTLGGILGALFTLLEPELRRRFPDRGLVMVHGDYPHLQFPAIHPEVGDIAIYDDGDELTVVYGNFTHCHYGKPWDSPDQWRSEAVAAVISDLEALFSDRLKMWGSHEGSGGIVREGFEESSCPEPDIPQYLWSGPVKGGA